MPFVRQEDIDPKIRASYERRHKATLRAALHDPSLTAERRQHLLDQIRSVGQAKIYDPESPPKPGALKFEPYPSKTETRALKKPELVKLALRIGVPDEGNKPDILKRVLDALER